ncbi:putative sugar O-methyltransferase [Shewanella halifaxensis]|uniref:putative sugar O-methyltransferase n=1 Tax=Shewanella halifaxensis TaxID=271098 RepID=UPI000D59D9CA|nr:putative sugar O-methyltransferase [Shewanella halifaxensis]
MNRSNIEQIISDMHNVESCYKPSHFWQLGAERLQQDLHERGISQFRSFASALDFFVPTYRFSGWINYPGIYQDLLDKNMDILAGHDKAMLNMQAFLSGRMQAESDYRVYRASENEDYPQTSHFSESSVGMPIEQFEFDGRTFSRSSLNYLMGINFLKQYLNGEAIRNVLEIGGGFGTLGEILLSTSANDCFYLNVDIPPTCIFSSYYLKEVVGHNLVADYSDSKKLNSLNISKMRETLKAMVICPWQLEEVEGEIDLFVNFISFQEMEPDIVENYLSEVDRLKSRFVLLRNLREGKQISTSPNHLGVKTPITGENYDQFLPNYDLLACNVLPFGYKTIDGYHSELRLYKRKA